MLSERVSQLLASHSLFIYYLRDSCAIKYRTFRLVQLYWQFVISCIIYLH